MDKKIISQLSCFDLYAFGTGLRMYEYVIFGLSVWLPESDQENEFEYRTIE